MFKYRGGAMGFLVLRFWLFFRSVFRFGVHYSLRILRFLTFGFRFSGKILTGNRCGFRFFQLDLFGFRFLFDLSGNYAPPLISNSR